MVLSEATTEKIPSDTTGIDPGTVRLVAQRLNHYATPDSSFQNYACEILWWSADEFSFMINVCEW